MQKRGAIELSMTTIIVIVLGVTLLILGLAFLQTTFKKVGLLTERTFEEGEAALQNLGTITEPLTLTSSRVTLAQGASKAVGVVVLNKEGAQATYSLQVTKGEKTAANKKLECYFAETESDSSNPITLSSGAREDFVLAVIDLGSDLGTYACNVLLLQDGAQVASESLLIQVESD